MGESMYTNIKHIVLDYNGTIAKDGKLKEEVKDLLPFLVQKYTIHVITADTFGSVQKELQDFKLHVKVLESDNHTLEKKLFIDALTASECVAIGNGNNDTKMIETAAIGVAILGEEGCSTQSLLASDITCKNITDALELMLHTKRLIATLRK